MYMRAAGNLVNQLNHHSEHVRQRQHGNEIDTGVTFHVIDRILYIGRKGTIGQHDSLGCSGCAGRIVNQSEVIEIVFAVVYIFRSEPFRVTFLK